MTYELVMGKVHGLTNPVGAFLVIFAGHVNMQKNNIRYTVAYYYFAFNSPQMLVLDTLVGYFNLLMAHAYSARVSMFTYMAIGSKIFAAVSVQFYSKAPMLFMFI